MGIDRRVELRFGRASVEAETHVNVSAVRTDGDVLWLAGDETATVERLRAEHGGPDGAVSGYADQRTYSLSEFVELPGKAEEEADIEGLALTERWLWAIGSHSLVRKKVKAKHDDPKAIKRLAKVRDEANRHVIARLAVDRDTLGVPHVVGETADGRRSAVLGARREDSLTAALAGDEHLAEFLRIPAKDNGLDVEGIAAHGDHLYIGLRGPVLRGWAVILEIAPRETADSGRLRLDELDGMPYRKHFLDLDGLGVRDLCPHGDDLLVLAGPSMDLDGPVRVLRWHGAARTDTPEVVRAEELTTELEVPYGHGDDHAEGLGLLEETDGTKLLVVYDSPADERRPAEHTVLADVFPLP